VTRLTGWDTKQSWFDTCKGQDNSPFV
jgi:hypothetical protein